VQSTDNEETGISLWTFPLNISLSQWWIKG